jgi:deoxyribodipyrimidine photo-lyase
VVPPEFASLRDEVRVDTTVAAVVRLQPGETAARETLERFLGERLPGYGERNDPNTTVCSDLSPYLHFGMISAQRVLLRLREGGHRGEQADSFTEELVVRRELADNYVMHTEPYDQLAGFPAWAQQTLEAHTRDPRPHLYDENTLETAATSDPLWNAAQLQMVRTGKMHSYMRMYWAKKILEWSTDPATALRNTIRLNDRYSLDGRDSNGYAGIAWSIGGVHDRGWTERPVFGKIRYMNDRGAARKFNVKQYIQTWAPAQGELFSTAGVRFAPTRGKINGNH